MIHYLLLLRPVTIRRRECLPPPATSRPIPTSPTSPPPSYPLFSTSQPQLHPPPPPPYFQDEEYEKNYYYYKYKCNSSSSYRDKLSSNSLSSSISWPVSQQSSQQSLANQQSRQQFLYHCHNHRQNLQEPQPPQYCNCKQCKENQPRRESFRNSQSIIPHSGARNTEVGPSVEDFQISSQLSQRGRKGPQRPVSGSGSPTEPISTESLKKKRRGIKINTIFKLWRNIPRKKKVKPAFVANLSTASKSVRLNRSSSFPNISTTTSISSSKSTESSSFSSTSNQENTSSTSHEKFKKFLHFCTKGFRKLK